MSQDRLVKQFTVILMKMRTCERLEAMKVEVVGLQEIDASTTRGRGQLLGDSMH
jgi:hypothetical protein